MTPVGGVSLIIHLCINIAFWTAGVFGTTYRWFFNK